MTEPTTGVCVYCLQVISVNDYDPQEHKPDCPLETNVYPVLPEDLTPHGFRCPSCLEPFQLGDHYTNVPAPPGHPIIAEVPEDVETVYMFSVCLGCAAGGYEVP